MAGPRLRISVLGELEVVAGDRRIALTGRRERTILAALAVDVGRVVPLDRLVDAVWEQDPPETAAKQVRNAVARLRTIVRHAGTDVITTLPFGYRLDESAAELDFRLFESEVADAARAAADGDVGGAVRALDRALGRWRGPALAGMASQALRVSADGWDEQRLAARLTRVAHRLELGEHADVLAELAALVHENPLREQPVAHLMTALYRSGRRADALTAYARLRARLAEELGLDPQPALRELQQRILLDDPELNTGEARAAPGAVPPPRIPAPRAAPRAPSQLPADVRHFAGRAECLKVLDTVLDERLRTGAAVLISAIDGTAGIGKTALAVHWAHQVASRFPDGQLYQNLRGFDPSGRPMSAAEAVRGLLEALNLLREWLPPDYEAQLAMYHRLLAGRQVLIVLDNARDAEQVRPLLPREPGCVAVVTSRRRLTGLAVADGAHPITLDLLTRAEARDLMGHRLGPERVGAEPAAVDEIIESCARLPLALSVAAARAAARSELPLAQAAAQLRDTPGRLDVLDTADPTTDVRAVFSWSYQHLSPPSAALFRLLGIAPTSENSVTAIASLAAVPATGVRRTLAELTRASLLTETVPGRYAFHDLLRAYAAEQAAALDDEAVRRAALRRLLDHFLHSAAAADRLLHPTRDPIDLSPPAPGAVPERFADLDEATAWLEREHSALLGALGAAEANGFAALAWQLSWSLATYFGRRGHWADWEQTHRLALRAAEAAGDQVGQWHALRGLGRVRARFGAFEEAQDHLRRALALADLLGDEQARARTLIDLAWMFEVADQPAEALGYAKAALSLFRGLNHRVGVAESLNTVGWYLALTMDYAGALEHCEEALARLRELGHRLGEAGTLDSLGLIHHRLGELTEALRCYRKAIDLFRGIGDRTYEAGSLERLGDVWAETDAERALEAWAEALTILVESGHPDADRVRGKIG